MSHWIRSLVRRFARCHAPSDAIPAEQVEFSIEELEARRLPAADITALFAAQGTTTSTGTTNTADPVVAGQISGDPIVGIEFEFDRNGDGTVDGGGFVEHGLGDFTYDLRAIDSTLDDFEGSMTVRARAMESDGQGGQVAGGEWVSTEFFVFGPPPTLDGFTASEGTGDTWTFSGSVGGAHAAGATIEFGGALAGQSVQADGTGNFSLSVSLGEIDGTVTAKVIDSLGQESETAEFYCCSIPDPVFTSFDGTEGEGDVWTFSGSVSGPTAAGSTITFGGVLAGYTAQVDSNGNFSTTVQLGDVDGLATAQATDGDGRVSNEVEFYCLSQSDPPAPPETWQIASFSGTEGAGDVWTFIGTINGGTTAGATVTFGGVLAGYSTQVDGSGGFSFSVYLGNIDGYASAHVVDPTNLELSAEVYCCSEPDPEPLVISSFTGALQGGYEGLWWLSGTVTGANAAGADVTFGGVLAGATAHVGADGAFFLSVTLPGVTGAVTALAAAGGEQSNMAEFYLT